MKDLHALEIALKNFIFTLNEFYLSHNNLKSYHTLSYFLNNLLFNMTSFDALDFTAYVNKIISFYQYDYFDDYDKKTMIMDISGIKFYVERILEEPGLETLFVLRFSVKIMDREYALPLIRYAFDKNSAYHIFAIQFGWGRNIEIQNENYKKVINKINTGIHKYRNVSPSFVVSFSLFINLLRKFEINDIIIPDYLFGRYRHYYKAQSEYKSDEILFRILNGSMNLIQRMEYQFFFFEVISYPNDIDSSTHIKIVNKKKGLSK